MPISFLNERKGVGYMKTYKLFRVKGTKLYPLYVEADREMQIGKWLEASIGEKVDDTHVKAKGCSGRLALRGGFHSTKIPFTDWIGKKQEDGSLAQRQDTVWCECEVKGNEVESKTKKGYEMVPYNSYYYFKTNSKQKEPWIISDWIKVVRILSNDEVADICLANGVEPQKIAK